MYHWSLVWSLCSKRSETLIKQVIYSSFVQGKPVQELYIFKDQERSACEVPVVLLLSLVNRDFRKFTTPGVPRTTEKEFHFSDFGYWNDPWDFNSVRFTYPELAIDRLSMNIEFNIQNNLELIKQEIIDIVAERRNKHSEMTKL